MSYRWGIFAAAAIVLGATAWYFGRPQKQKEEVFPSDYGLGPRAQIETPHDLPPKVIEVIDLARAYEPVSEPERPTAGGVDPASFIEERRAPRIPPAKVYEEDLYRDLLIQIGERPTGSFWPGVGVEGQRGEKLDVMPRQVPEGYADYSFFLQGIEVAPVNGSFIFTPEGIQGIPQIPVRLDMMPREVSEPRPVRLDVMPREVQSLSRPDLRFFAKYIYNGPGGPSTHLRLVDALNATRLEIMPCVVLETKPERLDVMPREMFKFESFLKQTENDPNGWQTKSLPQRVPWTPPRLESTPLDIPFVIGTGFGSRKGIAEQLDVSYRGPLVLKTPAAR